MKHLKHFLFAVLLCILIAIPALSVSADTVAINDNASLYSSSEKETLTKSLKAISSQYKVDINIVATDKLNGLTPSSYATEAASKMSSINKVIIFISMDRQNRYLLIQGYGTAKTFLTNERCDKATKSVKEYFTNANYYKGTTLLLDKIDHYLNKNPKLDAIYFQPWVQLIAAIVIGAVIVLIMALSAGCRMTAFQRTYLDEQSSHVLGRYDHYIRTEITRTKRQSSNNNSGSSGSSSHSEGGTSF